MDEKEKSVLDDVLERKDEEMSEEEELEINAEYGYFGDDD